MFGLNGLVANIQGTCMPNNVTALRTEDIRNKDARSEIDLRDEQKALLEAEDACLTMLEKYSQANIGFVSLIRKLNYANGHPRTKQLFDRSEKAMGHITGLYALFNESHKIAQGMATAATDSNVLLSGGIDKDKKDAGELGPDLAELM